MLREGMEASEVRQLLGEPYAINQINGRVSWRYFYRARQHDVVSILGVFPRKKVFSHQEREVTIIFKDGRVETFSAVEKDLLEPI